MTISEAELDPDKFKKQDPKESLKSGWWLLELLPFFSRKEDFPKRHRWFLPHLGAHRFIHRGQKVHLSVAIKNGYHPKARFAVRDSLHSWDKIIGLNPDHTRTDWMAELHDVVELDLYDVSITNRRVEQLKGDIQNVEARKTVRDALDDLSILALQSSRARAIHRADGNIGNTLARILHTTRLGSTSLQEAEELQTLRQEVLELVERLAEHKIGHQHPWADNALINAIQSCYLDLKTSACPSSELRTLLMLYQDARDDIHHTFDDDTKLIIIQALRTEYSSLAVSALFTLVLKCGLDLDEALDAVTSLLNNIEVKVEYQESAVVELVHVLRKVYDCYCPPYHRTQTSIQKLVLALQDLFVLQMKKVLALSTSEIRKSYREQTANDKGVRGHGWTTNLWRRLAFTKGGDIPGGKPIRDSSAIKGVIWGPVVRRALVGVGRDKDSHDPDTFSHIDFPSSTESLRKAFDQLHMTLLVLAQIARRDDQMVDMPVGNVFTEVVESTVRQISKAGPNFDTNLSFDASSASEALHVLLGASLFYTSLPVALKSGYADLIFNVIESNHHALHADALHAVFRIAHADEIRARICRSLQLVINLKRLIGTPGPSTEHLLMKLPFIMKYDDIRSTMSKQGVFEVIRNLLKDSVEASTRVLAFRSLLHLASLYDDLCHDIPKMQLIDQFRRGINGPLAEFFLSSLITSEGIHNDKIRKALCQQGVLHDLVKLLTPQPDAVDIRMISMQCILHFVEHEDSYTSIKTASAVRKLVAILESKEKELCYMAAEVLASFVHAPLLCEVMLSNENMSIESLASHLRNYTKDHTVDPGPVLRVLRSLAAQDPWRNAIMEHEDLYNLVDGISRSATAPPDVQQQASDVMVLLVCRSSIAQRIAKVLPFSI